MSKRKLMRNNEAKIFFARTHVVLGRLKNPGRNGISRRLWQNAIERAQL